MTSYNSKPQHILPVTLKMLKNIEMQEDQYTIFSKPVETVQFIARLVQETQTRMRTELIMQDLTGSCTVFFYKKKDESDSKALKDFTFSTNAYAQIIANVHRVQGEVNLVGQHIIRLRSRQEVNEFYSQLILSTLHYTNKPKPKGVYSNILQVIRNLDETNSRTGVNIQDIQKNLPQKLNLKEVEENCEKMMSENLLCMGVDWNHYRLIN